ncbi:MAG: glycosyltransferase family 9 protein [Terriglobales bacterium]
MPASRAEGEKRRRRCDTEPSVAAAVPTRILIVKLSSLGDIVHALPVAASLRASFPHAKLAWVVEQKWRPLLARHPDLDEIFTIDSFALRRQPRRWSVTRADLARLRRYHPDWCLDLQGTMKSAVVTRLSGAPRRVGFAAAACRERGLGWAYNLRVQPRSTHVVDQMLELAAACGSLQRVLGFSFPIPAEVQREVDAWIADNQIGAFAFYSPGGGWTSKRWPSERFARLAELLHERYGLAAVLNRGPGERDADDAYRRANAIRARLFSGDVEHLGAVLKRARLVVGGDTGPLQLAAALQVPTVALFGPTDPARNGPYSPRSVVLRKTDATTYQRGSTYSPAMLALGPEEVADACGQLLGFSSGAAAPPPS